MGESMNLINVLAISVESLLMLVILAFLVILMVFGYMKRRKYGTQLQQLRDEIKVGDKVMTDTGVVGEVVDIVTEEEHKYFTIKTGSGKNFGFLKIHSNAVYYVYDKLTPKYATTESNEDEHDEDVEVVESVEAEAKPSDSKTTKTRSRKKTTK